MWMRRMMDQASQKVTRIDGLVYPNLILIPSGEKNTDTITKHWDLCLSYSIKS